MYICKFPSQSADSEVPLEWINGDGDGDGDGEWSELTRSASMAEPNGDGALLHSPHRGLLVLLRRSRLRFAWCLPPSPPKGISDSSWFNFFFYWLRFLIDCCLISWCAGDSSDPCLLSAGCGEGMVIYKV